MPPLASKSTDSHTSPKGGCAGGIGESGGDEGGLGDGGGDGGGSDGGKGTMHRVCSGLVHTMPESIIVPWQHAAEPPVLEWQSVPPHLDWRKVLETED